jgi:predicted ATPase/tetratricopeptide (TPR) repeat protein
MTSATSWTDPAEDRARRARATPPPGPSYDAPMPLSSSARLLGREADVARLEAKLAAGARLITLFGPGGIGKTVLGSHLARRAAIGGPPALEVSLDDAADMASVCAAVGRAFDMRLDARRDPAEQLAAVLCAHERRVVMLDACDRAVEAVASLLRSCLVAEVPTVFVVTSRELLGLTEEHAYEVGPLGVPGPGEVDSDAVELFLDRASRVRRDAHGVDKAIVADVVRALEGIPLAIELAAGRMAVLTLEDLRTRLSSRLGVLTSQLRTAHPRERTMRAAIAWSWTQLEAHEQATLRQLSVFRSGFGVGAAEAVVDLAGYADAPPVVDVIQSLRAKSFVRATESAGAVRLGLYEVVREFGSQALVEAHEVRGVVGRHAEYFVEQSGAWCQAMGGPGERDALLDLSLEVENLLAAQRRALDGETRGGVSDALRLVVHLEPILWTRIPTHAALELIDAALSKASGADVPASLRAEVLLHRSRALELMGQNELAEVPAREALDAARSSADRRLEGSALARLGSVTHSRGETNQAVLELQEAVDVLAHDPRVRANALRALGTALRAAGEVERSRLAYEEALATRARLGDERGASIDLACLAALHFQQGQIERARVLVVDARERSRRFDDRFASAYCTGVLACVLAELGEHAEALSTYEEALLELQRLGDRRLYSMFLGYSAAAKQLAGEAADARAAYDTALETLRGHGDRLNEGLFSGAAASLAWAEGDDARASRLFELARERLESVSTSINARLLTVLDLHLGHKDLSAHRVALSKGDERTARAALDAARARLADAAGAVDDHDDLRLAYRLLQRAVQGDVPVPTAPGALEMDAAAVWFRVGDRPRVDLRRRRALRLILAALAAERQAAPGTTLSMARLVEIGWPGEKIRVEAGLSRLYVTVRSLRELGLRHALLRQDDGYLLDPATPLHLIDA